MYNYRITVFTPTYNRAYILGQLYESLKEQTFTNFEWLIVDDGSSDDTEKLVTSWENEVVPFAIHYHKVANGGKHRAINHGLDWADGEIFFTVDSDDWLTADALEKIDRWFHEMVSDNCLMGIAANKSTSQLQNVNPVFSGEYRDKTFLDMNTYTENGMYVLSGERAIAFYTDFHKKYYYPEFEGERFLTEAIVYNRMAHDGYKVRFYNDIIWIYEYKEDGLTKAGNRLFTDNPRGYGLWLKEKAVFQGASVKEILKLYYTFTCELAPIYNSEVIAESINTTPVIIRIMNFAHKFLSVIRKMMR